MKTKDRILLTSLALFNEEGEPNVTTVDIAAEMDISPGNLYYHFKGKDAIIESLYLTMEHQLEKLLQGPATDDIDVENTWLYLYVIFEEIYNYRYFFRNIADLLLRYPSIAKRFRRLIDKMRSTAVAMLQLLDANGIAAFEEHAIDSLADNISLVITYWMNFIEIEAKTADNHVLLIHRGVFQVMSLIAPHLEPSYQIFYAQCRQLFDAVADELDAD